MERSVAVAVDPHPLRFSSTRLRTAVEAVRAGMDAITGFSGKPVEVEKKSDASPVTAADRAAEAAILDVLKGCFDLPVIAEESVAAGRLPAVGDVFILVDPLDGTKDYVAGRSGYTVNVALIEGGAPILGCVGAPASGTIYFAEAGRGAFVWNGEGIRPLGVRRAGASLDAVVSVEHTSEATRSYLSSIGAARTHAVGSSLKFCLIADGLADVYPRLGRTMQWDTAAGDAVLRAAGGGTFGCDATALAYGARGKAGEADYSNPSFVAIGDRSLLTRRGFFGAAG